MLSFLVFPGEQETVVPMEGEGQGSIQQVGFFLLFWLLSSSSSSL